MFLLGISRELTSAVVLDSSKLILSLSLNSPSFSAIKLICVSDNISDKMATVFDCDPTIFSPIIKSLALPVWLSKDDIVNLGHEGSFVSSDSKIPRTLIMSGVFKDIFLSWTRVPNGKLPKLNPSFNVVAPIPDPDSFDLSTTKLLTLFFFLILDDGFIFANVAINVASSLFDKSEPTLLICRDELPPLKVNLSSVSNSIVPSCLIKEYLSSSKGKNVSLLPELTAAVNESVEAFIFTSNNFLIVKVVFDRSTSDTNRFGKEVNKVLSWELSNGDVTRVRSESVVSAVVGSPIDKPPSHMPLTVVTPVIVTSSIPTAVTLANFGSLVPAPNFSILPTFIFPGNWGFELVTVLNPVVKSDLFKRPLPNTNSSFCTTSPVKVLANPTSPEFWSVSPGPPNIDFTSDTPKLVTAIDILESSTPSNMSGSLITKSPDFS